MLPYEIGKEEAIVLLHEYVTALPRLNSRERFGAENVGRRDQESG